MHIYMQDELINTIQQAENGEINHLDALIDLRQKKDMLEQSIDVIKAYEAEKLDAIEREASKYPNGYRGYDIKVMPGRKTFDFKSIPEIQEIDKSKKEAETKYKAAYEGLQKGIVQTSKLDYSDENSELGWVDENGEVLPFPDVNFGKAFLTVKAPKK
ncbi:MAG: hypothetical protein CMP77_05140 [Flavobacterium sp.]|nr:hypothetical protein [Flavobacterium sp.]